MPPQPDKQPHNYVGNPSRVVFTQEFDVPVLVEIQKEDNTRQYEVWNEEHLPDCK